MAQWGKTDNAANSVSTVAPQFKKKANTANQTAMYGNTSPNSGGAGRKAGVFGVSTAEMTGKAGVATVAVTAAGTGFTVRPTVAFSGGGGTGAVATATGRAITITPNAAGTGYANGNVITVSGGVGTSATATVTTGAGVSTVASLAIVQGGSYTTLPALTAAATTGGAGTGLTVNSVIGVNDVTVTTAGSGYATAPAVAFGGAGGSGAAGTAARQATGGKRISHAGWVLRTEGSGGRAGRIHFETLVAMGSITGDGADDTVLPQ